MRTGQKSKAWSLNHTVLLAEVAVKAVGRGQRPSTKDIADFALRLKQERVITWKQVADKWMNQHPNEKRSVTKDCLKNVSVAKWRFHSEAIGILVASMILASQQSTFHLGFYSSKKCLT